MVGNQEYPIAYQWKKKSRDWKTKKNLKAFINYLQTIDDGFGNLEDYIIQQRKKVLIVIGDMIDDMETN